MSELDREFRTRNAFDQLTRYGPGVETDDICDVLEAITDINDDLANDRSAECINESIRKAVGLLLDMRRPVR